VVFKSFMRSLGVGGPTIDAVLDNDQVRPGDVVTGRLNIQGGEAGRPATKAVLEIVARVTRKSGDEEYQTDEAIGGIEIPGPIQLGQASSFPFRLQVPPHTPVTSLGGRNFVWLRSGLDMPWAVDPADTDALEVHPTQAQVNVLEGMHQLGFALYKVDVDARSSWGGRQWVQEFEFRPATRGRTRYDEIEVVFENIQGNHVELMLQIDRAARGLGGMLMEMTGTDESWVRASIDASSPQSAAAGLQRYIA